MKRILPTILAALMILGACAAGVFAVGADASWAIEAVPAPDLFGMEISPGPWSDLTPAEQQELRSLIEEVLTPLEIKASATAWLYAEMIANTLALKDESKLMEFKGAHLAARNGAKASAAGLAFFGFVNDDDALAVAFKAGTLKAQLESKCGAYVNAMVAALQPVCETYLKPAYIEFVKTYAQALELYYTAFLANMSDAAKQAQLCASVQALFNSINYVDNLVRQGKWSDARAAFNGIIPQVRLLLSNAGLIAPVKGIFNTNARWYGAWWHYILFFLGFGFIWMWF